MVSLLIAANIFMLVAFVLKLNSLPPQLPLFYSRAWGEGQLADTWLIFIIPLFVNVFSFFNSYLTNKIYVGNEFVKKIFRYLDVFVTVSFTAIFVKIIFLIS